MEAMKKEGKGRRCIIYVDFKMKKVPKKLREPTQDWFGKKGISCNGAEVFYDQCEEEKNGEREANLKLQEVRVKRKGLKRCKNEVCVDGRKHKAGDLMLFFIDTVLKKTNAQDTNSTANVLYTICIRPRKEIPDLCEVILISDNAPNYVNLTLPLMAFYIMKSYGLRPGYWKYCIRTLSGQRTWWVPISR